MSTLAVSTVKSVSVTSNLSFSTGNTTGGQTLTIATTGYSGIRSNRTNGVGTPSFGEGAFEVVGIGEEFPYSAVIAHASSATNQYGEISLFKSRGTYTAGVPNNTATIDGDIVGAVSAYSRNSTGWADATQIQFVQTGAIAANGKANGQMAFLVSDSTSVNSKTMFNINTTAVSVSSTNTFNLGTSSIGASGYTYLPNGLKMNWGTCTPNSIGSNTVTFSSAFVTNSYGLSVTILGSGANAGTANAISARVSTVTNTGITVITANSSAGTNAGATSVYYMAIGV